MEHEEWRAIPGFDGYEASSLGRVRSVDRVITDKRGRQKRLKGKLLRPCTHSKDHPYPYVHLGRKQMLGVHRAVAWAFLGPQPPGLYVCHEDNDERNCRLDNLRYGTPQSNQLDRRGAGTAPVGAQHGMAKLTDAAVLDIKRRLALGEKQQGLADEYGVTQSLISLIKSGKKWSHLHA